MSAWNAFVAFALGITLTVYVAVTPGNQFVPAFVGGFLLSHAVGGYLVGRYSRKQVAS